jgi:DNA-binding LacI/PurR family transcriptional regulator
MRPLHRPSIAELTAEHLREGLRAGRWRKVLPGVGRLAAELDVSRDTVRAALRLLESEGLLGAQGLGRSRAVTALGVEHPRLRVGLLLHNALSDEQSKVAQVLLRIQSDLGLLDHEVFCLPKTQVQLRHDIRRITHLLGQHPADAWIVVAGSRELLEWCAVQATPCLALYGRSEGLRLAGTGPDKRPACLAATRQLLGLGHRRIVMIVRNARRLPTPGKVERAFLDELAAHGIPTGDYNLPAWEENPKGFLKLLESLFGSTPPTAMIISETAQFVAAMEFLARRRLHVPEQVSLVSTNDDAAFAWCLSGIAQISSDPKPIVRRVVRWVSSVRKGAADRRSIAFPAQFVSGGSIGPVWRE